MIERIRIRFKRREKRRSEIEPAEEHVMKLVEGDPKLRAKVRYIFDVLSSDRWGKVPWEQARRMILTHLNNRDAEVIRRGIRHADVYSDPRATLGNILLYMTVGSDAQAEKLKELIKGTKDPDLHRILGIRMFTHQMVQKIPEVGLGAVLEELARKYKYKPEIIEQIKEIKSASVWREEIRALEERIKRELEDTSELEMKGASKEQIREIQAFVHRQEEEQGKIGARKNALIWRRKKGP